MLCTQPQLLYAFTSEANMGIATIIVNILLAFLAIVFWQLVFGPNFERISTICMEIQRGIWIWINDSAVLLVTFLIVVSTAIKRCRASTTKHTTAIDMVRKLKYQYEVTWLFCSTRNNRRMERKKEDRSMDTNRGNRRGKTTFLLLHIPSYRRSKWKTQEQQVVC